MRAGSRTISDLLSPLKGYLTRGIGELSILLVDAPYTAEVLHAFTGEVLPVYRPLAPYLHSTYTFGSGAILIPRSSSMTTVAKSGALVNILLMFGGPDVEEY